MHQIPSKFESPSIYLRLLRLVLMVWGWGKIPLCLERAFNHQRHPWILSFLWLLARLAFTNFELWNRFFYVMWQGASSHFECRCLTWLSSSRIWQIAFEIWCRMSKFNVRRQNLMLQSKQSSGIAAQRNCHFLPYKPCYLNNGLPFVTMTFEVTRDHYSYLLHDIALGISMATKSKVTGKGSQFSSEAAASLK